MRIGIAVKPKLVEARETLAQLSTWLRDRGVDAVWTTEAAKLVDGGDRQVAEREDIPSQVDLIVVLGGDGTLLSMAKAIAEDGRDIPILAVNFGSLGFLTETTRPEIFSSIEAVLNGTATHDLRMMLRATATRREQPALSHMALNDVVFTRTALSRMIELSVSVGDQFVTSVKADGLIVATPTGSTAYNLAAGGPILIPSMGAFVLNPICPHTLSNRPLVVPDDVTIELRVRAHDGDVMVTVDGQVGFDLAPDDRVRVHKSATTFKVITPRDRNYFLVLRDKLRWGGQIGAPDCD